MLAGAVSRCAAVCACGAGRPPQEREGAAVVKRPRGGPQNALLSLRTPFSGPFGREMCVLEQSGAQRGETPLPSLGFPPRRLRSSALGSLPGPWLVMTCSGRVRPDPARLAGMCSGLGWRTGFPRAAPAV